jgi:regulator of RNase E activity RraA
MTADEISQDIKERYGKLAVATIYGGVRQKGYMPCFMNGVRNFTPGRTLVGVARTLRFVPPRADVIAETNRGADSPEYRAMGSCKPGDVLVCDAMGRRYGSIGGDVKLLQLQMVGAAGVVTDGAIRDLDIVQSYGLAVFAQDRTPAGGGEEGVSPFEENVTIGCGGVAVRPGDLIVGDDDGIVVVARGIVEEVIDWAEDHEKSEEHIKELIQEENVAPGKYYNQDTFERLSRERRSGT